MAPLTLADKVEIGDAVYALGSTPAAAMCLAAIWR